MVRGLAGSRARRGRGVLRHTGGAVLSGVPIALENSWLGAADHRPGAKAGPGARGETRRTSRPELVWCFTTLACRNSPKRFAISASKTSTVCFSTRWATGTLSVVRPAAWCSSGDGSLPPRRWRRFILKIILRAGLIRGTATIGKARKFCGRLLEIGCAYGFFLTEAQRWYEAEGVEISGFAARQAQQRGLAVQHGDFLKLSFPPAHYDVVCLFDCIEHLVDPHAYLQKTYHLLKPQGLVALTTGDISSLYARLAGKHWRLMSPPQHQFYFSSPVSTLVWRVSIGGSCHRRSINFISRVEP
ncbi:MAG: hypothetical protein DME26_08960 [Verrucomicrobia bacterium]|nr:MAG: hypothetical protein DME26_08960 [Verrucomicrobiota bacterium]